MSTSAEQELRQRLGTALDELTPGPAPALGSLAPGAPALGSLAPGVPALGPLPGAPAFGSLKEPRLNVADAPAVAVWLPGDVTDRPCWEEPLTVTVPWTVVLGAFS